MKSVLTLEKAKGACNQRTLHDTAVMPFAWQYYYIIASVVRGRMHRLIT